MSIDTLASTTKPVKSKSIRKAEIPDGMGPDGPYFKGELHHATRFEIDHSNLIETIMNKYKGESVDGKLLEQIADEIHDEANRDILEKHLGVKNAESVNVDRLSVSQDYLIPKTQIKKLLQRYKTVTDNTVKEYVRQHQNVVLRRLLNSITQRVNDIEDVDKLKMLTKHFYGLMNRQEENNAIDNMAGPEDVRAKFGQAAEEYSQFIRQKYGVVGTQYDLTDTSPDQLDGIEKKVNIQQNIDNLKKVRQRKFDQKIHGDGAQTSYGIDPKTASKGYKAGPSKN